MFFGRPGGLFVPTPASPIKTIHSCINHNHGVNPTYTGFPLLCPPLPGFPRRSLTQEDYSKHIEKNCKKDYALMVGDKSVVESCSARTFSYKLYRTSRFFINQGDNLNLLSLLSFEKGINWSYLFY